MCIHVIGDSPAKLSAVNAILHQQYDVSSELLGNHELHAADTDAVIVTADLTVVDNILALKNLSTKLKLIRKRIFLVEERSRLGTVQAYALGATHVLTTPVSKAQLLAKLVDHNSTPWTSGKTLANGREAALAGAACIASMFSAVVDGVPIDVDAAKEAGRKIAESIAEDGLSYWLDTVRRHHEGTYQHCLLVTGVAVDFGLSLGLRKADMERLYSAAMFHDIGKARIPLAVLEKPAGLSPEERTLIESHPEAGYAALAGTAGISPEILDAVRHHHEYLDGSGYLDGLCGAAIADIVRLLTISDIFSALIENREYRPPLPRETAYEILQGMHGKLEMPLVAAFREVALTR
jgi:putative nucleotidyltransferase with HDIG domain